MTCVYIEGSEWLDFIVSFYFFYKVKAMFRTESAEFSFAFNSKLTVAFTDPFCSKINSTVICLTAFLCVFNADVDLFVCVDC